MAAKSRMSVVLRQSLLAFLYLAAFIIPPQIIRLSEELQKEFSSPALMQQMMLALVAYSVVASFCISYPILHARLSGLRLIIAMILSVFGLEVFMGQIETFFFRSAFPSLSSGDILDIIIRGFLTALIFVPLAVLVLGKFAGGDGEENLAPRTSVRDWIWKVPFLAVGYVVIYFLFGYFVAWQFAEVRIFYTGSSDIVPFFQHFAKTVSDQQWFVPFQLARGVLWIVFSLPIIIMLAGKKRQTIMSLCLLFGLFGLQIGIPNPLFPDQVRLAHLLETTPSTALYGALIGYFLSLPPSKSS
ncbi:MAG TPA: hypothetical protein DCP63_12220 [Bacteroidetes bacterium]|nr:hypothetical protein [Bacteroidota bacterium]